MKKLAIALGLCLSLALVSCSDDEDEGGDEGGGKLLQTQSALAIQDLTIGVNTVFEAAFLVAKAREPISDFENALSILTSSTAVARGYSNDPSTFATGELKEILMTEFENCETKLRTVEGSAQSLLILLNGPNCPISFDYFSTRTMETDTALMIHSISVDFEVLDDELAQRIDLTEFMFRISKARQAAAGLDQEAFVGDIRGHFNSISHGQVDLKGIVRGTRAKGASVELTYNIGGKALKASQVLSFPSGSEMRESYTVEGQSITKGQFTKAFGHLFIYDTELL